MYQRYGTTIAQNENQSQAQSRRRIHRSVPLNQITLLPAQSLYTSSAQKLTQLKTSSVLSYLPLIQKQN